MSRMTRKRASTSQNPKPKKRNKSQLTEVVKEMAEIGEKVQLDYLVVEKIASLTELKFAPDICQELVSSTFANALRSFYSQKKLKLSFSVLSSGNLEDYDEYPDILLSISGFSQKSKEEIKIDGENSENLNDGVQQIFTRFRRIHLEIPLNANNTDNDYFASIISEALSSVRDVTIETLDIAFEYFILMDCQRLIQTVSKNLQVLNLFIYDPMDYDEEFWQTVGSCTKLDKLSVEFDFTLAALQDLEFETNNDFHVPIGDAIKQLKIKHFRINLRYDEEEEYSIEWLVKALAKNENLRHLDLDSFFETGCHLDDFVSIEDGPLVLSRLDSLKLCTGDWPEHRKNFLPPFEKILPALSDHAVLKVTIQYCKSEVRGIVRMYLELSHQTARKIKLRLLFSRNNANVAVSVLKKALRGLSALKKFRGLKMIPNGAWTRLLFGNANLMVKAMRSTF